MRLFRDVVILTKNGTPETVRWADLRVGDLVLARTGQQIPADLMILCTSQENNLCAAQTANIDGETNLKPRSAPKAMHRLATQVATGWLTVMGWGKLCIQIMYTFIIYYIYMYSL